MKDKILITGAAGQVGTDLYLVLKELYGSANVIATDIVMADSKFEGQFQQLNVTDLAAIRNVVKCQDITQIYHLAALLSASGEQNPKDCFDLNMGSLLNIIELAKSKNTTIKRIIFPSSIAVFGNDNPKDQTPQNAILHPTTMYGITKVVGELCLEYYNKNYNLDIRSLRYPGLVGYKVCPQGGTTDYATQIFYEVIKTKKYTSFLSQDTVLPMMYIDDAIQATIKLAQANKDKIQNISYNINALSFSVGELVEELRKYEDFKITYKPDFRQKIANSWPKSMDDSQARADWGFKPKIDMKELVRLLHKNVSKLIKPC